MAIIWKYRPPMKQEDESEEEYEKRAEEYERAEDDWADARTESKWDE